MCVLTHENQVGMQITSQFPSFPSTQPLKYLVFTMSATTRSYEKSQWTRVRFPTRRVVFVVVVVVVGVGVGVVVVVVVVVYCCSCCLFVVAFVVLVVYCCSCCLVVVAFVVLVVIAVVVDDGGGGTDSRLTHLMHFINLYSFEILCIKAEKRSQILSTSDGLGLL